MKTLTIEWNAVTTLGDPSRSGHVALKNLVAAHGVCVDLGIVAAAASENNRAQELPETSQVFEDRLVNVGLWHLPKVPVIAVYGITFLDGYCMWAPDHGYEGLIDGLWDVIPGSIPRSLTEFSKQRDIAPDVPFEGPDYQKWRNHWCDVHSMLGHIIAKRDVFVTGDKKNFKGDRREKLIDLGIGDICTYDEAWSMVGQ